MRVLAEHRAWFCNFSLQGHIFGCQGAHSGLKGSGAEIFHQKGKWGGVPHKPRLEWTLRGTKSSDLSVITMDTWLKLRFYSENCNFSCYNFITFLSNFFIVIIIVKIAFYFYLGLPAIKLLLLADEEKQRWCLIRNFSRLLGEWTSHKAAEFYCCTCLHPSNRQNLLDKYTPYCKTHAVQPIKMPIMKNYMLLIMMLAWYNNVNIQFIVKS